MGGRPLSGVRALGRGGFCRVQTSSLAPSRLKIWDGQFLHWRGTETGVWSADELGTWEGDILGTWESPGRSGRETVRTWEGEGSAVFRRRPYLVAPTIG